MNDKQITAIEIIMAVGPAHCYKHLKFKYPELYEEIVKLHGNKFIEKCYRFVYNFQPYKYPKCEECGTEVKKFRSFEKGYNLFCSTKCVGKSQAHKDQRKRTSREKYGTDSPNQSTEITEKRRQTLIERYGTDNLTVIRWRKESQS